MKQAKDARPDGSELSAELGPLPPADLTLPSIAPDSPDGAHFYRASTVLRLLAAERERGARIVERINGWVGTREIAAEIRGETQILRA
jgi:hypothetical protein